MPLNTTFCFQLQITRIQRSINTMSEHLQSSIRDLPVFVRCPMVYLLVCGCRSSCRRCLLGARRCGPMVPRTSLTHLARKSSRTADSHDSVTPSGESTNLAWMARILESWSHMICRFVANFNSFQVARARTARTGRRLMSLCWTWTDQAKLCRGFNLRLWSPP